MAARAEDRRPFVRGNRRNHDGAGVGCAGSLGLAADPGSAARSHAKSRPQIRIRVRHALSFRRPYRARTGVRALSKDREPAPRAVGAPIAALFESPAARAPRAAIRYSEFGTAARNPAHRRYLLSAALDGLYPRRTPLARGGPGGAEFSGTAPRSFRAAAMDGPQF